ncbi:hypothetical protein MA16_Dca011203 [Dendrobium catenatum]|uniref:Uncharacterized protein n=1 Tax=Dendrobium catenatum TaxID=906689 RepID=A0A2I0VIJ0_9ASPA|nr:hypothetical protein MA16_Dca011203 [Dendrobium catenatum]
MDSRIISSAKHRWPISNCTFSGSKSLLFTHAKHLHGNISKNFCYDKPFLVVLEKQQPLMVLLGEDNHFFLLLNNHEIFPGNVLSVICMASDNAEVERGELQQLIEVLSLLQEETKRNQVLCLAGVGGKEVFGKHARQTFGSSSRAALDPQFWKADDEADYHRYKSCSITLSRTINPVNLSYPLSTIGISCIPLPLILTLTGSLQITFFTTPTLPFMLERLALYSKMLGQSSMSFALLLLQKLETESTSFTYYLLRDKRKPNLELGHLIAYVLESKYQLQYPAPLNLQPPFYSNNSFNVLHSTSVLLGDGEA